MNYLFSTGCAPKNLKKYLLCLAYVLLQVPVVSSQQKNQEIKTTVSNLHINAFAQDRHGYLWIATARGLCRYNGYEYVHYFDVFGQKSRYNNILDVYSDRQKDIWVLNENSIAKYDIVHNRFISINSSSEDYFYGIFERRGQIYIYGSSGIFRVNKQHICLEQVFSTNGFYDIKCVTTDSNGNIWCGTGNEKGFFCLDSHFRFLKECPIKANYKNINVFFTYSAKEIWLGTDNGIQVFNRYDAQALTRTIPTTLKLEISVIKKLNDSTLLIGTKNKGAFLMSLKTFSLSTPAKKNLFKNLTSNHITCFFKDANANIWLGTFDKGIFCDNSRDIIFNKRYEFNRFIDNRFITRVVEDKDGNIWMGTRYYGLLCYNTHTHTGTEYNLTNHPLFQKCLSNFVQSLMIDSKGRLWIGCGQSLCVCNLNHGKIAGYNLFNNTGDIVSLAEDTQHQIWCGSSFKGLFVYNDRQKKLVNKFYQPGKTNNVTNICLLSDGDLVISVYSDQIYRYSHLTNRFTPLTFNKSLQDYFKSVIFISATVEKDHLWLGTYGRGMIRYNLITKKYTVFSQDNGLCSNDVLSICKDKHNNLWISTSFGLSRYSPHYGFINYYEYDGIGGNQFHEKCFMESAGNILYFGGNHGLTYFNPSDVKISVEDVPVILENLKIYNQDVNISDKSVLPKQLSFLDKIVLHHNQNVFSIEYSGIDFAAPGKIKYAYMLTGIDKDWNYVDDFRKASYSNLPPGKYLFRVKAQNKDGQWSKKPTQLEIVVKPAIWATFWAKLFYFLFLSTLTIAIVRFYVSIQLNKGRMILEKQKDEHENNILKMKINFFTNISHELRTPLTMIYGPVKLLMENSQKPANLELLNLVNYNVERLLKLIDQLLDFSKLESDTMDLCVKNQDIMPVITNIINSFSYYAKEKNVQLMLDTDVKELPVLIDIDKLDKILNNLVNNSLKYSVKDGKITVSVDLTTSPDEQFEIAGDNTMKYLQIAVSDNGLGMKEGDIGKLFDRYKRFDSKDDNLNSNITGTGIGLHFVKRLIDKHKGKIIARSGDPRGMTFLFIIPVDKEAYQQQEIFDYDSQRYEDRTSRIQFAEKPVESVAIDDEENAGDTGEELDQPRNTILVVEDNLELRRFICAQLTEMYAVIEAEDGEEGYEKAFSEIPDLIVSDVLMPRLNGYDLCHKLKNDTKTCHIPVIMLTAKTTENDQIEGYSSGVDAYLKKPFNPKLLKTVINTIFNNREKERKLIIGQPLDVNNLENEQKVRLNPLDRKFLDKLYGYIDKELSNCDLNVNSLGSELCFSRTSFYRKVKALTGQTPNDFLRIYRLNKAAELVLEGGLSLNQISEMTGFGTQSHFSTLFKKYFGVSPRDYKSDREGKQ